MPACFACQWQASALRTQTTWRNALAASTSSAPSASCRGTPRSELEHLGMCGGSIIWIVYAFDLAAALLAYVPAFAAVVFSILCLETGPY